MAWAQERRSVEFAGGSFTVRGLNLRDIAAFVSDHRDQAEALFGMAQDGPVDINAALMEAPELIAAFIERAADEEGDYATLPVGATVDALEKIGSLTFGEGGLGKMLETLISASEAISSNIPISMAGSLGSDEQPPS